MSDEVIKHYNNISEVSNMASLLDIATLSYLPTSDVLTALENYYANLLIIQYHDKPKAIATVKALVDILMPINSNTGNLLITDVRDAFNVDTAVGEQLDWIGQWVGIDRLYSGINLSNTSFIFFDADLGNNNILHRGYLDLLAENPADAGTWLDISDLSTITNSLNDDDFRKLVKLKILENNMNFSWASLVNAIYSVFGNSVYIDTNGAMHMAYFVPENLTSLLTAMVTKKILPRPLGVTISGLVPILDEGKYFGFFDADMENSDIAALNISGYLDLNDETPSEAGIMLDVKNIIDA